MVAGRTEPSGPGGPAAHGSASAVGGGHVSETTNPLLSLLRETYGDEWNIRRSETMWIASTRKSESDHAPTIIESDVERFVALLEDPPARVHALPASDGRGFLA